MYQFSTARFAQLGNMDLYAILKLRQDVFMLEQQSLYADLDQLDQTALHLMLKQAADLLGYVRLRDVAGEYVKIERVVTLPAHRGTGLGSQLFEQALFVAASEWPQLSELKLAAQVEALGFYRRWGFEAVGEVFDDGGIAHQVMQKTR